MYGFWNNKRIVLFDTLLSRDFNKLLKPVWDSFKSAATQHPVDVEEEEEKGLLDNEVLSVMGHELGHWKLWHTFIEFVIDEVSMINERLVRMEEYQSAIHYRSILWCLWPFSHTSSAVDVSSPPLGSTLPAQCSSGLV